MRRRIATGLVVLGVHTLLIVWLTWPLARHLATHLPDPGGAARFDTLLVTWALAWQSHALATDPASLPHGNAFHPAPFSIFYGEAGLGALPWFLPTYLFTGNPALAINLVLLAGLALTAASLHLVVQRWTGSHAAGLVAGAALLMNRWVLWSGVPSAPNYALLFYLPAIVLLAAELPQRPGAARWLLPLVVAQCLTSVYVAVGVLVPLGVLAAARLLRPATRTGGLRLAAVVALALPAVGLLFAGYLRVRHLEPALASQTHMTFGPFPALLPWNLLLPLAPTAVSFVLLPFVALGAVVALRERPAPPPRGGVAARTAWLNAAFWALAGALLAIPPNVVWQGRFALLPHTPLLTWTPFYGVLRVPSRLAVGALVGVTLLVGLAFGACERRLVRLAGGRRLVATGARVLLCAAVIAVTYAGYAHHFAVPPGLRAQLPDLPATYPLRAAISGDEPIVALLRRRPGPLLELPVPLAPAGHLAHQPQAEAMYRSIFHWRPVLNGYSGYWPGGFPERMALARQLPDAAALDRLRRESGLADILVHVAAFPPAERGPWLALAASHDAGPLRFVGEAGSDLLFEVIPAPRAPAG